MTTRLQSAALALCAPVFLMACATTEGPGVRAERADEVLSAYTVTDETRRCVARASVDSFEALDDERWLLTTRSGDTYLNEVGFGCRGAASAFNVLVFDGSSSQYCRGDRVRVRDTSLRAPAGSCSLGEFQALTPNAGSGEDSSD